MRTLFVMGLVGALAAPALAVNLVQNGDWATGDETGWTRWEAPWSTSRTWSVTSAGPTPPEGTLNAGNASFGWYQTIPLAPGTAATVDGDWTGNSVGWIEYMLFSVPAGTSDADIVSRIDTGNAADIAYKKDAFGMNPPNTFGWEAASLSPHPSGNGGSVTSLGLVVVALKLGNGGPASFDNIVVTPEPTTLLLGLPALLLLYRRRRA